jgi:hypothetical protein
MRPSAARSTSSEPTPIATHAFRRSVLEPERWFSLHPEELVVFSAGQDAKRIPLTAIRKVHLRFHRTKQRGYHQCRITLENGQTVFLQDMHWAGFGQFEAHGATYTAFVRALHEALLPHRDRVQFKSGSLTTFILTLLMAPVVGGALVLALMAAFWVAALGLAVVLLTLLSLLPSARPRSYPPETPPADLLP